MVISWKIEGKSLSFKGKASWFIRGAVVATALIWGYPASLYLFLKTLAKFDLFASELSSSDVLSFYGALLSFAGTVVLGGLALYQNHIYRKEANTRIKILEKQNMIASMPRFDFHISRYPLDVFELLITNVSSNDAYDVNISNRVVEMPDGNIVEKMPGTITWEHLTKDGQRNFRFENNINYTPGMIVKFHISCTNSSGQLYYYEISGVINMNNNITFNISNSLEVQNEMG